MFMGSRSLKWGLNVRCRTFSTGWMFQRTLLIMLVRSKSFKNRCTNVNKFLVMFSPWSSITDNNNNVTGGGGGGGGLNVQCRAYRSGWIVDRTFRPVWIFVDIKLSVLAKCSIGHSARTKYSTHLFSGISQLLVHITQFIKAIPL